MLALLYIAIPPERSYIDIAIDIDYTQIGRIIDIRDGQLWELRCLTSHWSRLSRLSRLSSIWIRLCWST